MARTNTSHRRERTQRREDLAHLRTLSGRQVHRHADPRKQKTEHPNHRPLGLRQNLGATDHKANRVATTQSCTRSKTHSVLASCNSLLTSHTPPAPPDSPSAGDAG